MSIIGLRFSLAGNKAYKRLLNSKLHQKVGRHQDYKYQKLSECKPKTMIMMLSFSANQKKSIIDTVYVLAEINTLCVHLSMSIIDSTSTLASNGQFLNVRFYKNISTCIYVRGDLPSLSFLL